MSDTDDTNRAIQVRTTFRSVVLNTREQLALRWLLSASDNGQVISGYKLPDVMILRSIHLRLGRTRT